MRVIFSRDRAAQLDLLLRSLEQHAPPEQTTVIWYASDRDFLRGYAALGLGDPMAEPRFFDAALRLALARAGRYVTFFCDDDVVIRPVDFQPTGTLTDERVLTFSWRLAAADSPWDWTVLPRTHHGYPGSIDGHTFRRADAEAMLGMHVPNPTMVETVLVQGCERMAQRRPLMAAWHQQTVVGVPVNRVSESSGVPYGQTHPQDTRTLNARFLAGERIDLDALEIHAVADCHHEFDFRWRGRG